MNYVIMNKELTKAILDGRKTQTMRVIKNKIYNNKKNGYITYYDIKNMTSKTHTLEYFINKYAKYQKDEIIWVREPARVVRHYEDGSEPLAEYLADGKQVEMKCDDRVADKDWYMNCKGIPNGCIKEMARIFLKITDARVERLHDCYTFNHYEAEGLSLENENGIAKLQEELHNEWLILWNKTAPKGYKWEDNPYVFVYEFERISHEC